MNHLKSCIGKMASKLWIICGIVDNFWGLSTFFAICVLI